MQDFVLCFVGEKGLLLGKLFSVILAFLIYGLERGLLDAFVC